MRILALRGALVMSDTMTDVHNGFVNTRKYKVRGVRVKCLK